MEKIIIGVDVGGTKIMTGAIDSSGKVLGVPVKVLTESHLPKDLIVKKITDSIEQTISALSLTVADVAGIGIGTTGPLDISSGIILECPQLPTMQFYPLREAIQSYFHLPVFINNDANCLIYGESILGAAAGKNNIAGFTLGTGIGCAIILDGKILNGSTSTAAEIWTSPYKEGIIEDYISGDGVSKIYASITGEKKSSFEIFKLAEKGDAKALETWNEFGMHLSVPLAWTINLLDPEIVVLGGSITGAYRFFKDALEFHLRKKICPVPAARTKVVLAQLGDCAGFIGAACLVLKK